MKKIIVIGAGIVGATVAYELARNGQQVIIIDRNEPGQATKAAAGIIGPWAAQRRNQAWYELAKRGARIYPEIIDRLNQDGESSTGYRQVGALKLFADEQKLKQTKSMLLKRKTDAPEMGAIHHVSSKTIQEKCPPIKPEYEALYIEGAARVDGHELRQALLKGAQKYGAIQIHGNAKLIEEAQRIIGIQTKHERIYADIVIVTAGAWMNELFEPLNILFDVYPQKAQIIHLEIDNEDTSAWPVIMPPNNQYMLAFERRLVIGATHETEAGFDRSITVGGVHEILSKALEIAPSLATNTLKDILVGFRPMTKSSVPIFGPLPPYDGLLLANGLGASGLTIGPFIGIQLAKIALNQRLDIRLDPYDPRSAIRSL